MYEFTQKEEEFLNKFGDTANGRTFSDLFKKAKSEIMDVSKIDSKNDYGAQVEGRKLVNQFIEKILKLMEGKKARRSSNIEEGEDEYL